MLSVSGVPTRLQPRLNLLQMRTQSKLSSPTTARSASRYATEPVYAVCAASSVYLQRRMHCILYLKLHCNCSYGTAGLNNMTLVCLYLVGSMRAHMRACLKHAAGGPVRYQAGLTGFHVRSEWWPKKESGQVGTHASAALGTSTA